MLAAYGSEAGILAIKASIVGVSIRKIGSHVKISRDLGAQGEIYCVNLIVNYRVI